MATYAIGDIQGCFAAFQALLQKIVFSSRDDYLWLTGDLVNRGPDSLATLRFVRDLGERAVTVLGNHDIHLLTVAEGFEQPRRNDTLSDVLQAPDRDELLKWLRGRPLMHVEDGYALVHAGLLPCWTVPKAAALAREAEAALQAPDYRDFIANLYGDEPDHWDDCLTGAARIRVIVNALTRLRMCTAEGKMDFGYKGEPEHAPPGRFPWFAVPRRASGDSTIVFGHWSALGLRIMPNVLALDSGCLWGKQLSAVRLEDRQAFQVPCSSG